MMMGNSRRNVKIRAKSTSNIDEYYSDQAALLHAKANLTSQRNKSTKNQPPLRLLNANLKLLLSFCLIASATATFFIHRLLNPPQIHLPRVVTPFPAPKLMDLPMFQGEHKESLYWGTYRPHVYFGVRARTPQSLVTGLMWLGVKDGRYSMRHHCQNSDDLKSYGWTQHNGRDYGHQILADHGMTLKTSFLKSKGEGSGYGGDWVVRLEAERDELNLSEERLNDVHLFFYVADEGGHALTLGRGVLDIYDSSVLSMGSRTDVGGWELHLKSKEAYDVHYSGFRTPHIHNLSELVQENVAVQARMFNRLQLPDTSDDSPNILVFQVSARIPFRADIVFVSGTSADRSNTKERVSSLTGTSLTRLLNEKQINFDQNFVTRFHMSDEIDDVKMVMAKAALGNMLGGIGYFYGQSKISVPTSSNLRDGDNFLSYFPAELYTAVPSRPFFPRGFLWDEGFHQLLIWRWDIHISLDIIGHWLDLMNADGWIPREQILGEEALSKVPHEFVLQHPSTGNPPTLFLVLRDLVSTIKANKLSATESREISEFLDRAFVRLEAWFQWFNSTQSGKEASTFFWHGRDSTSTRELNPKTLSSGLDDYPRASHPNEEERHLDLRCWMQLAADCMHSISEIIQKDNEGYSWTAKLLSEFELLNKMHFDNAYGAYFDYGNHTELVRLTAQREVLEEPVLRYVPHTGYVSLFPFMFRLIPSESWILEKQLDFISNRSILWSKFGIRSLAKTSSMYMKRNTKDDPPYWRGPIWMNMNYMILSSLHHYSTESGPYKERAKTIYNDLRKNLIRNVVQNYQQTGFLWEQYDPEKGKGQGTRLFTGWTSLIVLMMAEAYH